MEIGILRSVYTDRYYWILVLLSRTAFTLMTFLGLKLLVNSEALDVSLILRVMSFGALMPIIELGIVEKYLLSKPGPESVGIFSLLLRLSIGCGAILLITVVLNINAILLSDSYSIVYAFSLLLFLELAFVLSSIAKMGVRKCSLRRVVFVVFLLSLLLIMVNLLYQDFMTLIISVLFFIGIFVIGFVIGIYRNKKDLSGDLFLKLNFDLFALEVLLNNLNIFVISFLLSFVEERLLMEGLNLALRVLNLFLMVQMAFYTRMWAFTIAKGISNVDTWMTLALAFLTVVSLPVASYFLKTEVFLSEIILFVVLYFLSRSFGDYFSQKSKILNFSQKFITLSYYNIFCLIVVFILYYIFNMRFTVLILLLVSLQFCVSLYLYYLIKRHEKNYCF